MNGHERPVVLVVLEVDGDDEWRSVVLEVDRHSFQSMRSGMSKEEGGTYRWQN